MTKGNRSSTSLNFEKGSQFVNMSKHFQISPLPKLGSCGNSREMSWGVHLLWGRDAVTMRPAGPGVWGQASAGAVTRQPPIRSGRPGPHHTCRTAVSSTRG